MYPSLKGEVCGVSDGADGIGRAVTLAFAARAMVADIDKPHGGRPDRDGVGGERRGFVCPA